LNKADVFFQDLADLGVAALGKDWEGATQYYQRSLGDLDAWKKEVSF